MCLEGGRDNTRPMMSSPVPSGSTSSSPCDDPRNLVSAPYVQHHISSPEHIMPIMGNIPEKLDVSVDLSSFYGLSERSPIVIGNGKC